MRCRTPSADMSKCSEASLMVIRRMVTPYPPRMAAVWRSYGCMIAALGRTGPCEAGESCRLWVVRNPSGRAHGVQRLSASVVEEGFQEMIARIRRDVDSWVILVAVFVLVLAASPVPGAFRGVAGILAGALVTVAVGQYYYRRAERDLREAPGALRRESAEARHYTDALISYLEAAGVIEVRRASQGRPLRIVPLRGRAVGSSGASASFAVGGEGPPPDEEDKPNYKPSPGDEY
jgi:hypothetical protein